MEKQDVRDLMEKYKERLSRQLDVRSEKLIRPVFSREYKDFKREYLPKHLSLYEKACNISEKALKIKADPKKAVAVQEAIDVCHLNITPSGVLAFSILAPLLVIVIGALGSFVLVGSLFFVLFFLMAGGALLLVLGKLPFFFSNSWRMKASNQMVLCIFYVVTYMRHTSNLELAVGFASDHLDPPLALDLKKVLWDVETGRYENIKESLDFYLNGWRKWNREFIEAFHLIESSLYEPGEERRLYLLDKALDIILSETYEKMLHFAHNLQSPITMLHMLGIILPILGLVILPLVVNFLSDPEAGLVVKWYHISLLYNVILPIAVYYLGKNILSKRPTGYGDTDISETNPEYKKYKNIILRLGRAELKISPLFIAVFIGIVFFIIGFSPMILHAISPGFDASFMGGKFKLLDYHESKVTAGEIVGPYGIGASIISVGVILAIGLSLGIYFMLRSKNVIRIREKTKELEDEFASALFQLGNRLGDGLPAEIAFGKVAEVMTDTVSGRFFELVSVNISRLGMSVQEAIFNPRTGALVYFPSKIIESSMKVLIESAKKGPKIAAQAVMNVARYIKEIHKVNERLKDLMADIISSMKSQIKFLTPAIAGIVIGITSMVTNILGMLSERMAGIASTGEASLAQMSLVDMFGDGIPTYYFQIIVGIYVVQIIYILTVLSNGIENGSDKLAERYELGQNLTKSVLLYVFVSIVIMLLFNLIAGQIMDVTMTI
jgi:hypothetical protein